MFVNVKEPVNSEENINNFVQTENKNQENSKLRNPWGTQMTHASTREIWLISIFQ